MSRAPQGGFLPRGAPGGDPEFVRLIGKQGLNFNFTKSLSQQLHNRSIGTSFTQRDFSVKIFSSNKWASNAQSFLINFFWDKSNPEK
ncbi:unnamed protein product [Caretta caretta]